MTEPDTFRCIITILIGCIFLIMVAIIGAKVVVKEYFKTKLKFWGEWGKQINEQEKKENEKMG